MRASRLVLIVLTLGHLAAPIAEAQQPARVPRVGILRLVRPDYTDESFRQGLRDLGYVEGKTIVIEARYAEGQAERLPVLAAELVNLPVDVVLTGTTPAIRAVSQASRSIPIVMLSADPIGAGLVKSLARPGGNITGLSTMSPETEGKRMELLKAAFPQIRRVAYLWDSTNPGASPRLREIRAVAPALGLTVQSVEIRRADELDGAFAAIVRERADALLPSSSLARLYRTRLADFVAKQRLPVMYDGSGHVEAFGGLMGYGPDSLDLWRRAAIYVDKILKGAKPADLPIEQPTKFELVINLKAAKALGLTIAPAALMRADRVID
jgi:putative ABC transport system substrate-binding protein